MAKTPASDQIMPADKLKPLLALSKREPVQAAIGLTTDGEALILLHKLAKPKKVFAMLKAEAAKAKLQLNTATLRFGRAEVDADYDSSMVRFFLNKEAPGNMRVKLVEVVKRVAFQKVELNVDPALEEEPEDEQQADETTAATGTTPAEIQQSLASLARRIPQAAGDDPARRATLLKIAGIANDQLKAGDAAQAAATLAKLAAVLGPEQAAGEPGGKLQAAQENWTRSRSDVLGTLKQLETAIRAMRHPQGDAAIILVKAISANITAVPATRQQVAELRNYLDGDSIIDEAEAPNGFGIEVRIRQPLLPALAGIEQALPASS